MTRARKQAGALSELMRNAGAEVIEIPVIEIRPPSDPRPLQDAIRNLRNYDWLILTSVNGVEAFFEAAGTSKPALDGLRIAAIGPATREAIEQRGWQVDVVPEEYVAESVAAALSARVRGNRVLLARARVARDVIPQELAKLGAQVDVIEAYETVLPEASREKLNRVLADPSLRPHIVTFTSSSTVRNFVELTLGTDLRGLRTASIGPVTSATLRECGFQVHIEASEYTASGLVASIAKNVAPGVEH